MKNIRIETGKPYDVMIGSGLLDNTGSVVSNVLPKARKAAVITDSNVGPVYLKRVSSSLEKTGINCACHVIRAGEESKSMAVYEELLTFLAQEGITRSDVVIALGGGVVGDLAGFAAATWQRGISCIQIPTSLLAMVDSSVGGKTAIDLPAGKNLVGAFHQPSAVICDPDTLTTLPDDIFRDGCAEVIKYGVLEDRQLFDHLLENGTKFDRSYILSTCVSVKARYVSEDERESGVRRMLNLGHTFGHAIEAHSDFRLSHGKSVAIGLAVIARAAAAKGVCDAAASEAVTDCLVRFGLPDRCPDPAEELWPYVLADKKRRADSVILIVPERIGRCRILEVGPEQAEEWLRAGL